MPFDLAHFVTLDRQDGSSRAGAEISRDFDTSKPELRLDGHVQMLVERVGGYATVPAGIGSTATNSATYLGLVEAGAMAMPVDDEDRKLVLHAGVALPTSYTFRRYTGVTITSFQPRLVDYPQAAEHPTTGRIGIAMQRFEGSMFAQLDLGADWFSGGGALRVDGALGFDLGDLALMVESTNVYTSNHFQDNGALAVRFRAGPLQPYAALVGGLVDRRAHLAVTAGLDVPL